MRAHACTHTRSHGSGFPLPPWRGPPTDAKSGMPLKLDARAHEYSRHAWNINNMPRGANSILRYVKCDELVTGCCCWGGSNEEVAMMWLDQRLAGSQVKLESRGHHEAGWIKGRLDLK
eukprot:1138242-Pelagomonas_calceolata.AAC.2